MARTVLTFAVAFLLLAAVVPYGLAHPPPGPGDGSPAQTPRFSAGAELVTVDVVVLDESGDPIQGLTAEDFTITDEGQPRTLSRFEAVTLAESPETEDHEVRFVSSNASAGGSALRTFVVVFDDVHLARDTALSARRAVGSFLDALRPGDRVTLVPTSGGAWWHARIPEGLRDLLSSLRRLQGLRPRDFSAERMSDYEAMRLHLHRDPEVLAQVTRRYTEYRVIPEGRDFTTMGGLLSAVPQSARHQLFRDPPHPYISGRAAELYQAALLRKRATYDVLRRVCEALEATRGRKSILFVSEGFVLEPGLREYRDAVEAAQRANAAFHFLDARGLTGLPATADAQIGDLVELPSMSAQLDEAFLESQGGVSLAGDTGGRVIRNTNDLGGALRRLERESRAYYLLGFEPTEVEADGSFRRIEVGVRRPGVEVFARKGYYAPSREDGPAPEEGDFDPQIRAALESPIDGDAIPLRMTSYLLGPAEGKTTALFVADVDPRALALEEKGDVLEGGLEILLMVSNRDTGEQVARRHEIALSLPPTVYEQIQRTRLPLMLDVALGPGRHQARLLVHDLRSGAIGTVRHEVEAPGPDDLRISTPILTDVVVPEPGGGTRPRPLARRTFVGDRTITLLYQVHGAAALPEGPSRVVAGFRVESVSGTVVASGVDTELSPGSDGDLSQMAEVNLADLSPGLYAVVVSARDEVSGRTVQTHLPFRVAPRPGMAVVEDAAPAPGGDDPLERIRGYILDAPGQRPAPGRDPADLVDADPELVTLLERVGRYVREYDDRFSGVVAEEVYTQQVEAHGSESRFEARQIRVTRADMVFVRLGGPIPWACFRDVFEVDGHEVRDRDARLERLFLKAHPSALKRARAILEESAAFNIGPTVRTMNLPTLPLVFLHPANQRRFRFGRGGSRRIEGIEGVELRFEEVERPTIVRREGAHDLPAQGRVWIDPASGTVLRTEMSFQVRLDLGGLSRASLSVQYRRLPELAIWAPMEMIERYEDEADRQRYFGPTTQATARYSNYRRFTVTVGTEVRVPES